jgi:hypothetical protein
MPLIAAELANEQARRADDAALISHMKLQIEKRKLKRDKYGPKSERASNLPVLTTPTLSPKLRSVPRRSHSTSSSFR